MSESQDLDLALSHLLTPEQLPDLDIAVDRLHRAVVDGERILIVGDFDADGATSVALCMSLLHAFGAAATDYLVPNRFEYGYGLSPEIVDLALTRAPHVIVTVDNGVSSVAGVSRAREAGVDVIVTDHHLPGEERPQALALVNPNLPESRFASRAMAGVGVAYYLMGALRRRLAESGWFERREMPNLADYLDLVALGTVADVVPLDANNRRLVHQGLKRMRAGHCRPGIKALVEIGRRTLGNLSAQDLAFAVGPRLNAAGRLEDMALGIKCLLAESLSEARGQAVALNSLNQARQALESDMVADAQTLIANHTAEGDRFGVAVYDPSFHQGVVGIVAGRLRERMHRPAIVFADAGATAPDEIKGSARSVDGLHIRDLLDRIATRYPGLLVRFGGHAMAAGLSIKRVHFERFARIFDKLVEEMDAESEQGSLLTAEILSDGALAETEMTLENAERLRNGGPWGAGFPEPIFDGEFDLVTQRVVGETHLKLALKAGSRILDAIAFRQPPLPTGTRRVLVAYHLAVNHYGQVATPQLVVEYLQPLP